MSNASAAVKEGQKEYLEFIVKLKLQEMQQGLEKMVGDVKASDQRTKAEFDKINRNIAGLSKTATDTAKSWSARFKEMQGAVTGFTVASAAAFAALTATINDSARTFGDFQAQINTLQAVSGASAAELALLEDKALKLGASTKFSASQMALAQVEMAKLGFTSQEIMASLDGVVAAAAASGSGLAESGELIAGTVRGFGLAASDAKFVADVLAQAANASALGFEDLALSMKYVAPIAAASGQKLTDMVGIMGVLSNSMIKGETAGTALRGMMARLQNPTDEMTKTMKRFKLEIADAEGKIKPLPKIFAELQKEISKYSQADQNKALGELFGTEALSAASVLMKTSEEDLKAMIVQMEKASGAAQKMSDIMNQGLNAETAKLQSAIKGLKIEFGKELSPALEDVIKKLTELVRWVSKLPDPVKKSAGEITLLTTAVAGLTGALGLSALGGLKMIDMLAKLRLAAQATAPWLVPLLGPAGLAALGVGAATIGTGILVSNSLSDVSDKTSQKALDNTRQQGNFEVTQRKVEAQNKYPGKPFSIPDLGLDELISAGRKIYNDQQKLKADIAAKQQHIDDNRAFGLSDGVMKGRIDELNQLKAQNEELEKMSQNYKTLIKNKREELAKPKPKTESAPAPTETLDPEGANKASAADAAIKKASLAYDDQIAKAEKLITTNNQVGKGLNGMNEQLEKYSHQMVLYADSGKVCYQQFAEALHQAEIAAGILSKSNKELKKGQSLWLAADQYRDKAYQFKTVAEMGVKRGFLEKYTPKSMAEITPGTIAVFDAGTTSSSGHVETIGKDGRGRSDYTSDLIKQSLAMGKDGWAGQGKISFYRYKDGQSQEELKAQAKLEATQTRINFLKAEQAKLDKSSADFAKENQKFNDEIARLQTDRTTAETDAIKARQEAEKRAAEERKANFERIEQEIYRRREDSAQAIYDLEKQLAQENMTDFQRMQDNFNRDIAQREDALNQLKVAAAGANLDESQRKILLDQIVSAEAEILRLKGAQAKATSRGQLEDDKRIAAEFEALLQESAAESLETEQDALDVRREALSEREKELQLAIQMGQLSPEAANAESLSLLRERIKLKADEVALAQRDLDASNGDNKKANQERLNQLQGEQNDLLREQKSLLNDAQQLIEQKAQAALERSNQALLGMLATTGSLVTGMSALGRQTGEVVNGLKSGVSLFTQFNELMGKEGQNRANLMRGAIKSGKAVGPMGAAGQAQKSGMSDASASAIIGMAQQGGEMYWGFINSLMGPSSPQALAELGNAQKQHLLDMEQLDIQVMQKRLERKRRDGATTAELYAEEKELAEKQASSSIKAKELELERLKASSNSILGLFRSTQDDQKIQQAEQQLAAWRLSVEENLQADLRDLDMARWVDAEQRAREYTRRIADTRLAIEAQQASRTADPLDDIEATRNRAQADALKNFEDANADIAKRYGTRVFSPEALAEQTAALRKLLDDQKQADFEASEARRRLAEQDTQFFQQTQNAAKLAQIEAITQVDQRERALIQERGRQALANIDAQLNQEGISDTRRRALQQERLTTEQRITREVVLQAEASLRREENSARALKRAQAQGTETQTDDILADYEDALAALAEEERKAYRELSGVELDNTLKTIMQKRLNAEKEAQRRMKETIANEYKDRLEQQRTLLQENLELERRQWDDLIRTKEQQADAINAKIKQMEADLEQKRRERDRQLEAFNPDDKIQSAQFRADLAALDTDTLAWQGVDSLSNVENVGGLPNVSGETKRMGLLEEADLMEKKASNDLKRELIDREAYIKLMQQAQLVRVKAAEQELETEGVTRRRQLELEEEWANAYTRYQELAREAINARYEAQEKGAQKALQAEQDGLKAVQTEIEGYQAKIKALEESAQKDLRIVEDAIKQAERSTREWAGAWTNVAEEAKKAIAAMQAAQAQGANSIPTGMQVVTPRGSSATKTTAYSVAGPDGLYYATTSEMRAANGLAKGGFIADSSRFEGDKAGPFWLDRKEAVVPFDKWPEILRPFMPTAPQAQGMVFAPQISFPNANFSSNVDVRGAVNEILDEQRRDFARSVGQFA